MVRVYHASPQDVPLCDEHRAEAERQRSVSAWVMSQRRDPANEEWRRRLNI